MTFNINWDKLGVYLKFRGIVTAQDLIDANNYVISNASFELIDYQIFDFSDIEEFKITSYDINIIAVMDKSQTDFKKEMKVAIVTQDDYVKKMIAEYEHIMLGSSWITKIFDSYQAAKNLGEVKVKSSVLIQNKKIYYTDQGQGTTIVLLHGYLESLDIWKSFAYKLSRKFRVVSFDIPEHGASDAFSEKHSMELLAELIYEALTSLSIKKCFMIGHSMGGYVTLMFHNLFPERLIGFSLFHSHPFADTAETKKKRLREINFVKEGKKDLIAKATIPNAFATDKLKLFDKEINQTIEIALQTSINGIIANLYAMINRPDLSESLAKSSIPFLYIVGKKDNYMDYNNVVPNIKLPENSELCILEKSGHMGFIEEKTESLNSIIQFILNHVNK